jgi:hypothetical protein
MVEIYDAVLCCGVGVAKTVLNLVNVRPGSKTVNSLIWEVFGRLTLSFKR